MGTLCMLAAASITSTEFLHLNTLCELAAVHNSNELNRFTEMNIPVGRFFKEVAFLAFHIPQY